MASLLAGFFLVTPAAAQTLSPGPPGPFVVDIRGMTTGLPQADVFYPPVGVETLIPARAFGFEVGGHVYPLQAGPARIGVGVAFAGARGTTLGAQAELWALTPQVSANFGTGDGWSYLSAGLGVARMHTAVAASRDPETGLPATDAASDRTGTLRAINAGAGARWFVLRRMAIGFDLRVHIVGAGTLRERAVATPSITVVSASAGFSLR